MPSCAFLVRFPWRWFAALALLKLKRLGLGFALLLSWLVALLVSCLALWACCFALRFPWLARSPDGLIARFQHPIPPYMGVSKPKINLLKNYQNNLL